MQKVEDMAIGIALGAVPILVCFIAFWWISILFVPESDIFRWALVGLLVGILLDVFFLRGWIRRAYSMKIWIWIAAYLFYSIGLFGFFMGVPIFNLLLAIPAGVFVGRGLSHNTADPSQLRKTARQTAMFTSGILGLICIASAWIALVSPSTAADLKGMLGLPFQVTPAMIVTLILTGGAAILGLEWWLTVFVVKRTYRYSIPA